MFTYEIGDFVFFIKPSIIEHRKGCSLCNRKKEIKTNTDESIICPKCSGKGFEVIKTEKLNVEGYQIDGVGDFPINGNLERIYRINGEWCTLNIE